MEEMLTFILSDNLCKIFNTEISRKEELSDQKLAVLPVGEKYHITFHIKEHTAETKRLFSLTRKGKRNSFYGKQHTPETRKKISECMKKRPPLIWTEKSRKKLSDSRKGKKNPSAVKCSINGKTYNTVLEASKNLSVHKDTVLFRINSKNERWKEWFRLAK